MIEQIFKTAKDIRLWDMSHGMSIKIATRADLRKAYKKGARLEVDYTDVHTFKEICLTLTVDAFTTYVFYMNKSRFNRLFKQMQNLLDK